MTVTWTLAGIQIPGLKSIYNNDGFFDLFWSDRGSNAIYLGDGLVLIYDVTGKLVQRSDLLLAPGANRISMDRSDLKAGVYFLKVSGAGFEATERVLLR